MSLLLIQDTVLQAAKAITASLELETEIIDNTLKIVGGTGRYEGKIGAYEEDGQLNSNKVYAVCLKYGKEYITFDPSKDPFYDAKENELAEICCPIKINNDIVGLIGLIAFTENQRTLMMEKTSEFMTFLRIMGDLIAGKLVSSQHNLTLQKTINSLISSSDEVASFSNIVSVSDAIEKVKKRAMQVAQSNSSVLITGESGTGKDLIARSIHKESPRSSKPFISINCAAIPEMLLESELFGYEEGSFTGASKDGKMGKFQLANEGTIFLDEIGDMPLHLQAKLLAVLQNRQIDVVGGKKPINIDVRVIAATNKNLEKMILENQFREDLFFRLNVIPIHIPALRERPEDIECLINFAIKKFSKRLNKPINSIEKDTLHALLSYSWPGNVREVENVIEYAINMEISTSIQLSSLPDKIISRKETPDFKGSLKLRLAQVEKEILMETLSLTGNTLEGKQEAANRLGISESTLYRRLRASSLL